MNKILIKKMQTQLSDHFSHSTELTKPENRCFKEMTLGILKSKSIFVNQIAASLREPGKLCANDFQPQYLKPEFADKARAHHLSMVSGSISQNNFLLMDGTDISKKYAKYMEGLELVRNGDTQEFGLGYSVLNINAINTHEEISPLYS